MQWNPLLLQKQIEDLKASTLVSEFIVSFFVSIALLILYLVLFSTALSDLARLCFPGQCSRLKLFSECSA
jgi:hypothetical protein